MFFNHTPFQPPGDSVRRATVNPYKYTLQNSIGKKTPGGAGTHTGHTGHTGARGPTDHTDEPHKSQPSTQTQRHTRSPARPRDGRNRDRLNSRKNSRRPGVDRSPRPTQKRPPPANPTLPPPAPRAPPRACSKAVGEMKARAAEKGRCVAAGSSPCAYVCGPDLQPGSVVSLCVWGSVWSWDSRSVTVFSSLHVLVPCPNSSIVPCATMCACMCAVVPCDRVSCVAVPVAVSRPLVPALPGVFEPPTGTRVTCYVLTLHVGAKNRFKLHVQL